MVNAHQPDHVSTITRLGRRGGLRPPIEDQPSYGSPPRGVLPRSPRPRGRKTPHCAYLYFDYPHSVHTLLCTLCVRAISHSNGFRNFINAEGKGHHENENPLESFSIWFCSLLLEERKALLRYRPDLPGNCRGEKVRKSRAQLGSGYLIPAWFLSRMPWPLGF